jgi:alkanesulfonate monooxygenase SsuD/methylene tetrahydromethanopterin reductase-like flavin-dependent oxidoreductase (luciferase family)
MTLSAQIPSSGSFTELTELAVLADSLGYESINCSHIASRDSFSTLAALATVTQKAVLGTAVAPIYHRSPASMAQAAATIDDLAGGRFRLGLGIGHKVTMGGWHGQQIGTPTEEMREYVAIVRAILAGQTPPPGKRWKSTFMFNGFTPRPDIPIYLAALSPAMLRLAGEIADGVLLWACPWTYIRDVVIPEVSKGRARRGLGVEGFAIVPAIPSAVDADPTIALEGIRSELHRYFGLPYYRAMFEIAGFGDDIAAYDGAAPDVAAQKAAISEAFIAQLCGLGSADAVQQAITRYRMAGATNPLITKVLGTDFSRTLQGAITTGQTQ